MVIISILHAAATRDDNGAIDVCMVQHGQIFRLVSLALHFICVPNQNQNHETTLLFFVFVLRPKPKFSFSNERSCEIDLVPFITLSTQLDSAPALPCLTLPCLADYQKVLLHCTVKKKPNLRFQDFLLPKR